MRRPHQQGGAPADWGLVAADYRGPASPVLICVSHGQANAVVARMIPWK
jgi:hypothetical protein